MKLGARIFFCYILIFAVCFYYPIDWVVKNLRTRYLESVEDPLVDQANILAGIVGLEMETDRFDPKKLYTAFETIHNRSLSAGIYDMVKTQVDMQIYITDTNGTLIFDSKNNANVGKDYSKWRDVRLTLEGQYGARTTKSDPDDPKSSVLYVATPLMVKGEIAGVLTVGKPTTNINNFLTDAKPRIFRVGILSLMAAAVFSLLASVWITRPIKRLTHYADGVRQGKRMEFPKLGHSEIGEMGTAFEKMQEALEGKKYVEQYVQTLTHEIKSPLSAIRGAAELLEEKMQPEQRARFLSNIRNEAHRIQQIVDRLLELSELENLKILRKIENISFAALVNTVIESKQPMLSKKNLKAMVQIPDDIWVKGDSFLLHQAMGNLIQNAMDFSPDHSQIELTAHSDGKRVTFTVDDTGPGIPEYAKDKIFDRFFSLKRPDSGKKSTGLGLNFVQEVVILHNGEVKLENLPKKGARGTLILNV
ncbi:MAG: two-component system sensor histidine kinase CreC [Deltaproteobacteria bacterium]|nr:two-component system sensor histidine kinase CreC [Deltaproteobacteria bacterium]MBW2640283.1 two-component system sensor histidine kinase CreC [Deltaproteobacteria bacterium]